MGFDIHAPVQQEEYGGAVRKMVLPEAEKGFNYSVVLALNEFLYFDGVVGQIEEIVHTHSGEDNGSSIARIEFGRPLKKEEIEILIGHGFQDV